MNGHIPKSHTWCSYCIQDQDPKITGDSTKAIGTPCEDHRPKTAGPWDGTFVEYAGPDLYEPSDWVLEVVGQKYKGWGGTFECFGFDPRHGFWMRNVADAKDQRNISERAIGRTYHRVREASTEPSRKEHMQWAKRRALEYVEKGDWRTGLASMASDLTKHPETLRLIEFMALGVATVRGVEDTRKFIEGFGD